MDNSIFKDFRLTRRHPLGSFNNLCSPTNTCGVKNVWSTQRRYYFKSVVKITITNSLLYFMYSTCRWTSTFTYESLYFLSTGIVPFSETNFQDFSKIQIDFSRTLIFTLILLLPNHKVNYPYTAVHFIFFTWVQQIFRTFKYQKPFSSTFQSWKILLKMYPVSIPGIYKPLGDRVYQENTKGQVGYSIVHVYHESITQLFYIIP